jgi:UDP-N-acetylglucosamine--N-acetylmuramyl-(pentapeptide) pyrophosphoryl-undecaprenol N-acetylglucosamine transferase
MEWALTRARKGPHVGGIAITGGGTGGHVFPALAVAEEIARLWRGPLLWIGSRGGIERSLVRTAGIPFRGIPAGKLRRYFSLHNLTDLFKIGAGVIASIVVMKKERPALLFSKGGFVSVPPVIAASLCGIPCFTHESDYDPGLATRINLRFCETVFVSFRQTVDYLPEAYRRKAFVSGNPVRGAMLNGSSEEGRRLAGVQAGRPFLLVLGGSQGSAAVNRLVESVLPGLLSICFVVHQMGERDFRPSRQKGYLSAAFFRDELAHLMAAADLVVSRSGANSLAEIAALGKPSVLVPLPKGGMSRGDQIRNAELFRREGAAVVLSQEQATGPQLLRVVSGLLGDPTRLREMGNKARGLNQGNPAATIARLLLDRIGATAGQEGVS